MFPAVKVEKYDGVKVGFIGMTLENTPNIVTKSGVEGLKFSDEVETANRLAKRMDSNGVKSIFVLVHEGGFPSDPTAYNSCPGISGPIVDINKGLSPRIDARDLRSHAPGLQLQASGPQRRPAAGHQRLEPRPPGHQHQAADQQEDR